MPVESAPIVQTPRQAVDRVFQYALGRTPSPAERTVATLAVSDAAGKVSPEGLADLLWAVLVKPEFQLIY